jgi:hypothetical protein
MAEYEGAQQPRRESCSIRDVRQRQRPTVGQIRKEQLGKNRGGGEPENEEIIVLDGGPGGRREGENRQGPTVGRFPLWNLPSPR